MVGAQLVDGDVLDLDGVDGRARCPFRPNKKREGQPVGACLPLSECCVYAAVSVSRAGPSVKCRQDFGGNLVSGFPKLTAWAGWLVSAVFITAALSAAVTLSGGERMPLPGTDSALALIREETLTPTTTPIPTPTPLPRYVREWSIALIEDRIGKCGVIPLAGC